MDSKEKQKINSELKQIQLLSDIANNRDRAAMEKFYAHYSTRLGSFLYRTLQNKSLVEEVYNEVMLIIWRKASQFNGNSKVSTWVLSIAYRHGLQHLRKEKKHVSDDKEVEQIVDSRCIVNDQQQIILKAMEKLSIEHRTVIELAYFVGNNYSEIAEITGCPENTVKTRMFYARRRLQQELIKVGITSVG